PARRKADGRRSASSDATRATPPFAGAAEPPSGPAWSCRADRSSEILSQVHPGIEAGDLIAIAVEHQGRTLQEFADATLLRLAPAWMVDLGIDVGIEAVFVRGQGVPQSLRLLFDEADGDDRLDALETVFPGHDQTNRRPVLRRQNIAIQADGQEC